MGGFFLSWLSVCLHDCQKLKKEFSFIVHKLAFLVKSIVGFYFIFKKLKVGDLCRNAQLREIVFNHQ